MRGWCFLPLLMPISAFSQVSGPSYLRVDNARLLAIFDADQHDRSPASGKAIDWTQLSKADEARRAQVRAMLDAGALQTGTDYYHAAFVFQHGGESKDFLLAHTLAVTAIAKGRADAGWIAAATLDRYLQKIDRPQVYGTQFLYTPGHAVTQEPYDRTLVSDSQRRAAGVPILSEQGVQLRGRELTRQKASIAK